jgi:putative serine protease PepD
LPEPPAFADAGLAPGPEPAPGSEPVAPPTATPAAATTSPRPRRGLVAAGFLVVALVAGAAGGYVAGNRSTTTAPTATATVRRASLALNGQALDVASLLDAVEPSVVSVDTTIQERRGPFVSQGEGAGTGIVLDDSGHILTNAHVVAGATSITVTAAGQTTARTAHVVASDTAADVAVLAVDDASGLVPASFATDGVQVGDQVVAIGNALALEGGLTVTEGIVSAVDRSITTDSGTLHGLIQTDAAISSGNSGGPLVDATGHVVGMNAAVAASGNGVEASNIGFAISIHDALAVAQQLLA